MSTSPLGNYLVSLTKAERALQAAQTLPEIRQIIDLAGAAKEYAKAASLGDEWDFSRLVLPFVSSHAWGCPTESARGRRQFHGNREPRRRADVG